MRLWGYEGRGYEVIRLWGYKVTSACVRGYGVRGKWQVCHIPTFHISLSIMQSILTRQLVNFVTPVNQ